MRVNFRTAWCPKRGCEPRDYEDAFWPRTRNGTQQAGRWVCAVADGATDSSFSRLWARQLARAVGRGELDFARLARTLGPIQERWQRLVRRRKLAWYAEQKAQAGAFAAVVALTLLDRPHRTRMGKGFNWLVAAVGDCCIFCVRDRRLRLAFPLTNSEAFSNRPFLLPSVGLPGDTYRPAIAGGLWKTGDKFYLASDATAQWFLRTWENGRKPWDDIQQTDAMSGAGAWGDFVENLRASGQMRDDDTTMMEISMV